MTQRRVLILVFAAAALAAGVLIAASLAGRSTSSAPVAPSPDSKTIAGAGETNALLRGISQDGIVLGSPEAPVTLVEFADLQCPYCAEWAREAFPAVVDEYVRPGRVRIVFRGLAFIGPESERALRAVLAAGEHDRLWNVLHLLYSNQGAENGGWVTNDLLDRVGESVRGLDSARWQAGFSSTAVERELLAAQRAANAAGIRGTPSFLAGRTGGRLEPLALTSLEPTEMRAHLDRLLAG